MRIVDELGWDGDALEAMAFAYLAMRSIKGLALSFPGTTGVHPVLLRKVEPFPTLTDLKSYSPEFVRGWTVERYQIDLHKASELNRQEMQQKTEALCSAQVPGDTQRNLNVDADFQGRTFKHVLVPVWLVSYTYGSKSFQVLANGYTGTLAGEYPKSWVKIFFAVLATVIVFIILVSLSGKN